MSDPQPTSPSTAGAPVLEVRDLSVSFTSGDGDINAVNGVSFDVYDGETLAIVGESGSGKSVSSLALMGLLPRTATITGSARFGGRDLLTMKRKEHRSLRGNDIAMIFQDPMTALNPVFTVGAQIVEAIRVHNDVSKSVARRRAIELLDLVGIPSPDQRVDAYPHEYSGGMRQRAMIAMAISNEPKLLIADEPTTALDVTIQAQVLEVMVAAQEATGASMILITHDLGLVAGVADRVQVMYGGRVFESADLDTVFKGSRNPYTRGLLSSIPSIAERDAERLDPIPGSPPSPLAFPRGCVFRPRCEFATERCTTEPVLERIGEGHHTRCHHHDTLPALHQEVVA